MTCLNSKNIPSKVNFPTIFFGHSMTSEVKGHFYKVQDNFMKCIYENFRNDIWTGLCVRRFQRYKFKWHVLKVKIFRQRSISKHFLRPFNDLWGQRSILQSWRQSSQLYTQKFSYWYLEWLLSYVFSKQPNLIYKITLSLCS